MRTTASLALPAEPARTPALPEASAQALLSWSDGPARRAIVDFVTSITDGGGPDYVAPADRVATFDTDGTLWPENPLPFELAFILDQIKRNAGWHREWMDRQPYKSALEGNLHGLIAQGRDAIAQLFMATRAAITADAFDQIVHDWIAVARHPRYNRRYAELAYQPMLDLFDFLRAGEFRIFLVSSTGAEFTRAFAGKLFGIAPEHVVGTQYNTRYEVRNGLPALVMLPDLTRCDDNEGKARAIHHAIGRRPIAAFGNSDGDQQMLQLTTVAHKPSLGLIVHHTDAEREYAYDGSSMSTGKLVAALAEARSRGWTIVDMKRDWKRMFRFEA